jgi:hypothetical protein
LISYTHCGPSGSFETGRHSIGSTNAAVFFEAGIGETAYRTSNKKAEEGQQGNQKCESIFVCEVEPWRAKN